MLHQEKSYGVNGLDNHNNGQDVSLHSIPTLAKPSAVTPPLVSICETETSNRLVSQQTEPAAMAPQTPSILTSFENRIEVLSRLARAHQAAVQHDRSLWDFAMEITELASLGTHVLRELICEGKIQHRRETTTEGCSARVFANASDLILSERSCFVISTKGLDELADLIRNRSPELSPATNTLREANAMTDITPIWDTQSRELRLGEHVVKQFKWPAINQEAVLQAFSEEGWPTRIDDPLPPSPNICPKRRLHDTIKCLNRRRVNKFIKFRGDGTGEGVLLEIVANEINDKLNQIEDLLRTS